jgi:predicted glutamine amidotransferase
MCGIAGISLSPNDQKMDVAKVAAVLLKGIASRGPDATGAAWFDHTEDAVKLTKIAVPVAKFLTARQEVLPKTTPAMILHTRMSTHGSTSVRGNNHPIRYDNIIGVHNGVLWDHKGMFKDMNKKPNFEVDSEAIFALLSGGDVRPEKVLNKTAGDAAIAWINLDEPEVLHLARVVDRPLFIAQTEEGSLLFASTALAIKQAAKENGLTLEYEAEVEEAKYLKVIGGVIAEFLDIPGVKKNANWSQKYAYTSGAGGWDDYEWEGGVTTSASKGGRKPDDPKAGTTKPAVKGIGAKTDTCEVPGAAKKTGTDYPKGSYSTWFTSKTVTELVSLAKNGSLLAEQELEDRGRDHLGVQKFHVQTQELVAMADEGSVFAQVELAVRGLNTKGVVIEGRMSVDSLVTEAAGGSQYAIGRLRDIGYDRTGTPLLPIKPATKLVQVK